MNAVKAFLRANGFSRSKKNIYVNNKCSVMINLGSYRVVTNEWSMFSNDLNIYWLIGVLTYYGYMDKNYKQLNK